MSFEEKSIYLMWICMWKIGNKRVFCCLMNEVEGYVFGSH